GAGVARIDYTLGATNATGVYTGPLTLPAAGEIFVSAVDAAGNVQTGPTIGTLDDRPGIQRLVTEFLAPHFNTTGCIDYPGDVDWWGLQLAAGSHMLQLIGLSSDYDLALFGAAGEQLGESASPG